MIHPHGGMAPLPHRDLPHDVREDYEEAMSIMSNSSRSAAALLRLTLQKLTNHILGKDKKQP
jgi:hypothetical protein